MGGIFKDSNLGRDLSVNFFNFSVLFEIEVCKKKSVNGLSAPGPGLGGFQVQSWSISKSVAGNRCLLPVVSKCLLPADGRLCQQMCQLAQVWILKVQRRGKGKRFHFMRWLLFLLDTLWASNQIELKEDHSCKSLCNEWLVYWMVSEDPYSLMSSAFGHCPNTIRLPPELNRALCDHFEKIRKRHGNAHL